MLWTVHGVFLPAWAFDYSEQMHLLVGRASGPVKITDLSLQAYLPLSLLALVTDLSSLGLCSPNAGLVPHSCPPLITQLRSPEEVVQDGFVNTPSHTDHLPSPSLL